MLEKENPWIMSEKAMFAKKEFPIYEFGPTFNIKNQTIKFYRLKEENTQLRQHQSGPNGRPSLRGVHSSDKEKGQDNLR